MHESVKKFVRDRARGCCEYCLSQENFSPSSFSVEHTIPISKGGNDDLSLLALSCQGCNNIKFTATTALDPASGAIVPLFNPRTDIWMEHFQWSDDFIFIVGTTSIGRASVSRLQLNRLSLLNLREVMVLSGKHPPQ